MKIQAICSKCKTKGMAEVGSKQEGIRCATCGNFAYRNIGFARVPFIVLSFIFAWLVNLPGDFQTAFVLGNILFVLIAIPRCTNIGISRWWALAIVVPLAGLYFAFTPQAQDPKAKERAKELRG